MDLAGRVLSKLGIQPAERALFGWASLCLFSMGAAAFAFMNTAETLFLKRVGVDALPIALLATAALLVLTTAQAAAFSAPDPARGLPRILLLLALLPVPFVFLTGSQSPVVFGTLVLAARQVLALAMLAFWMAMGSLVPARRAKQLFAPLASGVTVGGILGSFGSGPLAALLGVDGLLAFCAVGLGISALLGARLRHHGTRQLEGALRRSSGAGSSGGSSFGELLRTSRLFRLMGVALLCGGALSPILYFEFTSVLDAATQGPDGEQRMLGLYSQFRGWLNVAILVSQLWLSTTLYRNLGLPLTLSLWPTAYVIGFGWLGLSSALGVAFVGFGAARVAEDGVSSSANKVLYNLFPDGFRARAAGLLEGPVNRVGGVLGNGLVLGLIALGLSGIVGWVALPVALAWLVTSLLLWHAYPGLLLQASAEHGLAGAGIDRAMLLDASTLRSLAADLTDRDPRVCRAALDLLVDGDPPQVVRLLSEAILQTPEANRPLLVEALVRVVDHWPPESSECEAAAAALTLAIAAKPPLPSLERADLLQVYARLTAGEDAPEDMVRESKRVLERALGDRAAPVRLAAIVELHRRGAPPPGLPDLDRTLSEALAASDGLIRRAARKELREILLNTVRDERWNERLQVLISHLAQRADRVETADALREVARRRGSECREAAKLALRFASDYDPRVRGAILAIAGHAELLEEAPQLVAALGSREREEVEGAREGLVALGPEAAIPVLVGFEFGGPARREAVLQILGELEVGPDTLLGLQERQLGQIREAVIQRAAIDAGDDPATRLLRRRLEERVAQGLGAYLALLAATQDDPRIAELERRLRRSSAGRDHDLLVEAIEALLHRSDRDAIVPLLEHGGWQARGREAAAVLGRPVLDAAAALAELRDSPDATSRGLARSVLEGDDTIGDAGRVSSSMDIAVRLQEAPAFARLSTQQLLSLAEQLQEQRLAAGERVYGAGEEGFALYFVLEGVVEIRRGALVLERADAGSFFGELSTLDGLPRSTDAVAAGDVVLLRLDREDLLPLMEEVPGLAVGLAQLLSSRVRGLQDRLEQAVSPIPAADDEA